MFRVFGGTRPRCVFSMFQNLKRGLSICQGCGTPRTKDPTLPGFIPVPTPPNLNPSFAARKARESEIFKSAISSLSDATRSVILPIDPANWEFSETRKKVAEELCTRCHSLKYHSGIPQHIKPLPPETQNETEMTLFKNIAENEDCLVLNVIDILDFPTNYIDLAAKLDSVGGKNMARAMGKKRVIHVFNRIDLLFKSPLQLIQSRISTVLKHILATLRMESPQYSSTTSGKEEILFVSALKGWGIDSLATILSKHAFSRKSGNDWRHVKGGGGRANGDVYIIGSANAGKSSLIASLSRHASSARSNLIKGEAMSHDTGTMTTDTGSRERRTESLGIASYIPGTTLAQIPISISKLLSFPSDPASHSRFPSTSMSTPTPTSTNSNSNSNSSSTLGTEQGGGGGGGGSVIDTPGIISPKSLIHLLPPNLQHEFLPRKFMPSIPLYSLKQGCSLILGDGLIWIEYRNPSSGIDKEVGTGNKSGEREGENVLISNVTELKGHVTGPGKAERYLQKLAATKDHIYATLPPFKEAWSGILSLSNSSPHSSPHSSSTFSTLNKTKSKQASDHKATTFGATLPNIAGSRKGGENIIDLVIQDLGFISIALFKGSAELVVNTPGGIGVHARKAVYFRDPYDRRSLQS